MTINDQFNTVHTNEVVARRKQAAKDRDFKQGHLLTAEQQKFRFACEKEEHKNRKLKEFRTMGLNDGW